MTDSFLDNRSSGDQIGSGSRIVGNGIIVGKQIHIEGDLVVKVSNEAKCCGLNLLPPKYFVDYKSTMEDFENWKKGFPFKLESIKDKKEFRRKLVDEKIKTRLEEQHRLLIIGESGTSKSTILMEIICDYCENGYQILYNFGDTEMENGNDIVNFVQDLLNDGNKILVAVDNAHNERTSAIYYAMDHLSNHKFSKNVIFVLTARLPELDWFINERLSKVPENYRLSVRKITDDSKLKYKLPPFSKDEIKDFINLYSPKDHDELEKLSDEIDYATRGNPIMVKFSVLRQGLDQDVKEKYDRYLSDPLKMQTMLVCLLLDMAELQITDELLSDMELLMNAIYLDSATLYRHSDQLWKTIHLRWDIELLSFLFDTQDSRFLLKNREYLKKALELIINVKGNESEKEKRSAAAIEMLYTLARSNYQALCPNCHADITRRRHH